MKKISILLLMTIFIAACNNTATTDQNNTETTETISSDEGTIQVAILDVTGMHCEGCVNTITNSLSGLEGVENVKVSLEYEQAKVKFDSGKVSTDEFKSAIEGKGYGVAKIEVVPFTEQGEKPRE